MLTKLYRMKEGGYRKHPTVVVRFSKHLTQSTFTFNPELPAYNILNTRIGVLSGVWDIAFFTNNVTDARAFLALDQERGTLARVGYLTNPPRRVGISTRVGF